jgi:3-phenylpropionate/cinnamic acid dioxygenase small subunit
MTTPNPAGIHMSAELLGEIEQFLFREAYLLDHQRFDEWLALFTGDATYWVPLEQDQTDPLDTLSILYDDRTLLELRVKQYRDARAHARVPLARTAHQVSNVLLLESTIDELRVGSTLMVVEYRQERQRVFGASVEHRLRRTPDGLRIAAKRVDLVNSESELDGIAFLL